MMQQFTATVFYLWIYNVGWFPQPHANQESCDGFATAYFEARRTEPGQGMMRRTEHYRCIRAKIVVPALLIPEVPR